MLKKELIGEFYREGKGYGIQPREVNDHDFISSAKGVIIPHGIYDLKRNEGYITIGTSHDTSEFSKTGGRRMENRTILKHQVFSC
jgi:hypothetical protein